VEPRNSFREESGLSSEEYSLIPTIDTSGTLLREDCEIARMNLRRLQRCAHLRATWKLYLGHNPELLKLLDHVADVSHRECVRYGMTVGAVMIATHARSQDGAATDSPADGGLRPC
jgi:hypothetical protein